MMERILNRVNKIVLQKRQFKIVFCLIAAIAIILTTVVSLQWSNRAQASGSLEQAFQQASDEYGVPAPLLKALCYMEGRFSIHNGTPSIDGGYGCNLTKNKRVDTLDQAAKKLGVDPTQLEHDLATNIRGAAFILSEDARRLSPSHTLPTHLEGWRGALELYSNARSKATAHLYANEVYTILKNGVSTPDDQGEIITIKAQTVSTQTSQPNVLAAAASTTEADDPGPVQSLPAGCSDDGKTDYPGAIDCILDPAQHDCDIVPGTDAPCNYFSSDHYGPTYRQNDKTITHVVIHDIEGTAPAALNAFQDPTSNAASHYIVDSDGTVYQTVREKDVPFQAGNLWFNQHSIGIEHAGYDATGFQWYNATEYLASAKLTAYLLQKYDIPLDHEHIVSHGTVPAPTLATTPNHVDPGPYWLWSYYLQLIGQQQTSTEEGAQSLQSSAQIANGHILTLRPRTARRLLGQNGTETAANFNFFYLYNGPSTKSGLIPQEGDGSDVTDETNNVEPEISYAVVDQVKDPAGTGDTLYEIWYGESDQAHATNPTYFTHAKLAWLAVPRGAAAHGHGTIVTLKSTDGSPVQISGKPATNTTGSYHIGDAPDGSTFVSSYQVVEDGSNNVWYEINYNHHQAWVPANNVTVQIPT